MKTLKFLLPFYTRQSFLSVSNMGKCPFNPGRFSHYLTLKALGFLSRCSTGGGGGVLKFGDLIACIMFYKIC